MDFKQDVIEPIVETLKSAVGPALLLLILFFLIWIVWFSGWISYPH